MPGTTSEREDERQYEALKKKGMSRERAAKIANSPDASKHGGERIGVGRGPFAGRHHRAEEGRRPQRRTRDRTKAPVVGALETHEEDRCPYAMAARH